VLASPFYEAYPQLISKIHALFRYLPFQSLVVKNVPGCVWRLLTCPRKGSRVYVRILACDPYPFYGILSFFKYLLASRNSGKFGSACVQTASNFEYHSMASSRSPLSAAARAAPNRDRARFG